MEHGLRQLVIAACCMAKRTVAACLLLPITENVLGGNGIQRLTLYEGGDKDAQPLLTEQKQIRCTTAQIWHTAPLLYSECYRL